MQKILFIFTIILTLSSASSFADEKQSIPLCSLLYAQSVKAKLTKNGNDKYKHCAVSCMLSNRCGGFDSYQLGVLKEVWDLIGPGNAEMKDLEADLIGVRMSMHKMAINDKECNQKCFEYDWSKLNSEE